MIEYVLSSMVLALSMIQTPIPVTYDVVIDGVDGFSGAVLEFKVGAGIQRGVLGDFNCNGALQFVDVIAENDAVLGLVPLVRCPEEQIIPILVSVDTPAFGLVQILDQNDSYIKIGITDLSRLVEIGSELTAIATFNIMVPSNSLFSYTIDSLVLEDDNGNPIEPISELALIVS